MDTPSWERRAAAREFGEEILEALLWSAVEEELLRGAFGADDLADGLLAWGRDLLERWPGEVAGFFEACLEDESNGKPEAPRALAGAGRLVESGLTDGRGDRRPVGPRDAGVGALRLLPRAGYPEACA
jgi:hypothetical protein